LNVFSGHIESQNAGKRRKGRHRLLSHPDRQDVEAEPVRAGGHLTRQRAGGFCQVRVVPVCCSVIQEKYQQRGIENFFVLYTTLDSALILCKYFDVISEISGARVSCPTKKWSTKSKGTTSTFQMAFFYDCRLLGDHGSYRVQKQFLGTLDQKYDVNKLRKKLSCCIPGLFLAA